MAGVDLYQLPVHVSEFVPELVQPPPSKRLRDCPTRGGGRRTDFGRHFRADTFMRGMGQPAPRPTPGVFMVNGEIHVHPKTWEALVDAEKKSLARMYKPTLSPELSAQLRDLVKDDGPL
jgi:hypothetical protein